MKILITGASGLLGGRFAEFFSNKSHDIISLTRDAANNDSLKNYGSIENIDWNDQNKLNDICKDLDLIIHAAGPSVQECADNSHESVSSYEKLTQNLLKSIEINSVKKVIFLSSIHVYSKNFKGYIDEETNLSNNHPYALGKIAVENIFNNFNNSDTKCFILRLANCYGYPATKTKSPWNLFVNNICRRAITDKHLLIENNPFNKRDFIPITYLCEIIDDILNNNVMHGTYNVSSGKTSELLDFASYIKNIMDGIFNNPVTLKYNNSHKKMDDYVLSNNKIKSQVPTISINHKDEIKDLILYCKKYF